MRSLENWRRNLNAYLSVQRGSKSQLASGVGISHSYLTQMLTGHRDPSAENMIAISNYLNVSVETLLTLPLGTFCQLHKLDSQIASN